MLVEDAGVEADHFFGGEGVEHAAERVDFASNVFGGAAAGAFEDHVLDEVRDSVEVLRLAARNGMDVVHRLGENDEAVGQDFLVHGAIGVLDHFGFYSGMAQRWCHCSSQQLLARRCAPGEAPGGRQSRAELRDDVPLSKLRAPERAALEPKLETITDKRHSSVRQGSYLEARLWPRSRARPAC